jgi:hypothetical protein
MRLFGYDKKESEIRTLPRVHAGVFDTYLLQFNREQQGVGFLLSAGNNPSYFDNVGLNGCVYHTCTDVGDYSFLRLTYSKDES